MRARHGYARIANHRGRCPPDRISRPHMGRECVDPPSAVRLGRPVRRFFIYLFVHINVFGLSVWVGPLEMSLTYGPILSLPLVMLTCQPFRLTWHSSVELAYFKRLTWVHEKINTSWSTCISVRNNFRYECICKLKYVKSPYIYQDKIKYYSHQSEISVYNFILA
jgi:hypothetical protein